MRRRNAKSVTWYRRDIKRFHPRAKSDEALRHPEAPRTRGECINGIRPCPFVGCRYHLFLNVTPNGGVQMPHGHTLSDLARLYPSCALDVADEGPMNNTHIAHMFDRSEASIKEEVLSAKRKLKVALAQGFTGESAD